MGYTPPVSQIADGVPRRWWIGDNGTRKGIEVILAIQEPPAYGLPGINVSNVYTWKSYPSGRIGPPGGVISECNVTITPVAGNPRVPFYFVWETLQK